MTKEEIKKEIEYMKEFFEQSMKDEEIEEIKKIHLAELVIINEILALFEEKGGEIC